MTKKLSAPLLLWISCCLTLTLPAQPVTGVWRGKIRSTKIELKLIKKGDSLVGTSYYYTSHDQYSRYSVKGYLDPQTNEVVWWDDVLLEGGAGHGSGGGSMAVADFNCPGEGIMKLDGQMNPKNSDQAKSIISLQKVPDAGFPDEWDYVINNYTRGANDPETIDSVNLVVLGISKPASPQEELAIVKPRPVEVGVSNNVNPPITVPPVAVVPPRKLTVDEKFSLRTKTLQMVIPLHGDSLELRFYDNAEIDGDSIAIFLNGRMLEQHVLLSDQPHVLKIDVGSLAADNELVMVAENLGSIPPNTSLMVALVGDKRYEAHLESTEGSSALVRFVKEGNAP